MLTDYFTTRQAERLKAGLMDAPLDDFARWLASRGYRLAMVRIFTRAAHRYAVWATAGGRELQDIDTTDAYLSHLGGIGRYRYPSGDRSAPARATRLFAAFLEARGSIARTTSSPDAPPQLLVAYQMWMMRHRGLKASTLETYRRELERLVAHLGDRPESYRASEVRDFVLQASRRGASQAAQAASIARSFLRYLAVLGDCPAELVHAVPRIMSKQHASLPRYISQEDVAQLLASCDLSGPIGLRDRAVLLLLVRLALRAGDVAGLRFTDLDWQHGRLRVWGKSRREAWLPLPHEVGEALAEWLTRGRPSLKADCVFTKVVAPLGPMTRWHVSQTVRRAVERTGIQTPSRGAHMLRHTAATSMLAQGATLDEIGSVLRHASIEITHQYAKVDAALLRTVATAWPQAEAPEPDADASTAVSPC